MNDTWPLLNPLCRDGQHTFMWSGWSTQITDQPSGWCLCGMQYYDADERRVTMMIPGYNPFGPRSQPTLPPNEIPLANHKAARLIPNATHISADGGRVYVNDGERVYYWNEENKSYGSSFPLLGGLPGDAVKIDG